MDFLLIALLILLNGLFAMSEMALAVSRKARLQALAELGDKGAQAALRLMENPTQFLSTVQVGITSIAMISGIIGEAAFSVRVAGYLIEAGLSTGAASIGATAIVVIGITFLTIVFGELVPKRIGQLYPELVASWAARPMGFVARAAGPFVRLLSASTQTVLRIIAIDTSAGRGMTEEEIQHSLEEGVDAGVIEAHEHRIVRNVFHLDERPLTSMMVPRSEVEWLDVSLTVQQCLERAGEHSWYPVCRGSMDNVLGAVSVKRLLTASQQPQTSLQSLVEPPTFLPETLTGLELLEQFRSRSTRMVFVVDEYGVVQGLMTPHDLLEAITGELQPEAHDEPWATRREDGSWLLDGLMPIAELKSRLAIRELPDEDRGRYNTVAGLLMAVSGHMPHTGERIDCGDWTFEVVDLDGKRIDKVLAMAATPDPHTTHTQEDRHG